MIDKEVKELKEKIAAKKRAELLGVLSGVSGKEWNQVKEKLDDMFEKIDDSYNSDVQIVIHNVDKFIKDISSIFIEAGLWSDDVKKQVENLEGKTRETIQSLIDEVKELGEKGIKMEPVKMPKEIKISNLPKEQVVRFKGKPTWWKQLSESTIISGIGNLLDAFAKKTIKVDISQHASKDNPLAVFMVNSEGKNVSFEKVLAAIGDKFGSAGGGGGINTTQVLAGLQVINLNNSDNHFTYSATAPTDVGKYYMAGRLSSASDLVLFANASGKRVIVHGVSFTSSYTAEKEIDLHFGASGDNQGDAWYHNLGKDGGGNGFNMINMPIKGVADKGLYLDNGTGSYLYYSIWFEVIST